MFERSVRVVVGLFLVCECVGLKAQQNSWTNPTSGKWEEMHWSLGQLPGPGQAVFIENAGWKAVAIGAATVQNYAQSVRPSSITISSPTNSQNMLLLNYVGLQSPVSVLQLRIYDNAILTTLNSAIQVNNDLGGAFSIGGALNQGESSTVSTASIQIGDVGPGVYNLTNGILVASAALSVGGNFPSHFNQFGGSNYVANLQLYTSGDFNLSGGNLSVSNMIYRPGSSWAGNFNQFGGTVTAAVLYVTMGEYRLAGGALSASKIELPGVTSVFDYPDMASFRQSGGTNFVNFLSIGNFPPFTLNAFPSGDYVLSNGVLITTSTSLGPYGSMEQYGGTHTVDSLQLAGGQTGPNAITPASYTLSGGLLSTPQLTVNIGKFVQNGGTNQIGDLSLISAIFDHSGGSLINTGMLTLANSTWEANANNQQLGKLLVADSQATYSSIVFPDGAASLQFASSSSILWSNQAILTIEHWNGSLTGGGPHQLYFGNDSTGLSPQQLGQIQFHNPAGATGIYPAVILASGEVVPNQVLVSQPSATGLTLSWTPGMVLQSSTNAAGPFEDMTTPTSCTCTVTFSEPKRFFRLRSTANNQPAFANFMAK